ncbi:MAG: NAD(+)/NADH kinase, partial [Fusobacterium sp.]
MKKCVIFYNEEKKSAVLYYNQIKDFLEEEGVLILSSCDIKKADFAVVIGGDGTLLRASQKIIPNENIVVIAVNAGSLGFLTEVKGEEGVEACKNYLSGNYEIDS